jgi:CBS domain containing-hemolysin-like protein
MSLETINLLIVVLLILISAFFVAAEFSIVKVRRIRIDQLAQAGNKKAQAARMILDNLDGYLSACQLGITMASLGIGWLGEPAVGHLIEQLFGSFRFSGALSMALSGFFGFLVVTMMHVIFGELAPKTFAIQKAEHIVLFSARPLILFSRIAYPFIWILNGSANGVARLFGIRPVSESEHGHSEEELRLMLAESYKSGEINQIEMEYVNNVFEFDDRLSREIMIPRTEIICLYADRPLAENIQIIKEEKYTRYPVAKGDKDHIIGYVNIKDMFHDIINDQQRSLDEYIRPITNVMETTPVTTLLKQMQVNRSHMALVVDEYGGTAGIITVEDIVEEIVGDIRDEYDLEEKPTVQNVDAETTIIDGKLLLSEVNDLFGLDLDDSKIDTIGGWILSHKIDADKGTVIPYYPYEFEVIDIEGHQIKEVAVRKMDHPAASGDGSHVEQSES